MATTLEPLGHFVVLCNNGKGHNIPTEFGTGGDTWQFFKDHPYRAAEPYIEGLPSNFPSYCRIW